MLELNAYFIHAHFIFTMIHCLCYFFSFTSIFVLHKCCCILTLVDFAIRRYSWLCWQSPYPWEIILGKISFRTKFAQLDSEVPVIFQHFCAIWIYSEFLNCIPGWVQLKWSFFFYVYSLMFEKLWHIINMEIFFCCCLKHKVSQCTYSSKSTILIKWCNV